MPFKDVIQRWIVHFPGKVHVIVSVSQIPWHTLLLKQGSGPIKFIWKVPIIPVILATRTSFLIKLKKIKNSFHRFSFSCLLKIDSFLLTPPCTRNHVVLPIPRNYAMTVKFEYNNYGKDFSLAPIHPDFHHFRSRFGYTGHQQIITVFSEN